MPGIPLFRILVVLALPAALVLALSGLMRGFDDPITPQSEAQAMVWADRVFTSEGQFSEWLESRGVDYGVWVKRHPGVAPWESDASVAQTPGKAAYVPPASSADDGGLDLGVSVGVSTTSIFIGLVLVLGLLLIATSALPPQMLFSTRSPSRRVGILVIDRRPEIAAAGLSLLVGAGLPVLLA